MTECSIIANNNADFIIADRIDDGNIVPCLMMMGRDEFIADYVFDINNLLEADPKFRVAVFNTIKKIKEAKTDNSNSLETTLSYVQDFMEKKMPMNFDKAFRRNDYYMETPNISELVQEGMSMCTERSAVAQYIFQESGVKSYYSNSFASIQNVTSSPTPHAYLLVEQGDNVVIYDPSNPRSGDRPRILDINMNKAVFNKFIEAVNKNCESDNKTQKSRVGIRVQDKENGQRFSYVSWCGKKGEAITPEKIREDMNTSNSNQQYPMGLEQDR